MFHFLVQLGLATIGLWACGVLIMFFILAPIAMLGEAMTANMEAEELEIEAAIRSKEKEAREANRLKILEELRTKPKSEWSFLASDYYEEFRSKALDSGYFTEMHEMHGIPRDV